MKKTTKKRDRAEERRGVLAVHITLLTIRGQCHRVRPAAPLHFTWLHLAPSSSFFLFHRPSFALSRSFPSANVIPSPSLSSTFLLRPSFPLLSCCASLCREPPYIPCVPSSSFHPHARSSERLLLLHRVPPPSLALPLTLFSSPQPPPSSFSSRYSSFSFLYHPPYTVSLAALLLLFTPRATLAHPLLPVGSTTTTPTEHSHRPFVYKSTESGSSVSSPPTAAPSLPRVTFLLSFARLLVLSLLSFFHSFVFPLDAPPYQVSIHTASRCTLRAGWYLCQCVATLLSSASFFFFFPIVLFFRTLFPLRRLLLPLRPLQPLSFFLFVQCTTT